MSAAAASAGGSAAKKIVIFGGSGFVGSAIGVEAAKRGFRVMSLGRSNWAPPVRFFDGEGNRGGGMLEHTSGVDALDPSTFSQHLQDASAVVVSIGVPPWTMNTEYSKKMNGTTNKNILEHIATNSTTPNSSIKSVVLLNAAMPHWLPGGYRPGKLEAEESALKIKNSEVLILKPSVVNGTRDEGFIKVPLWLLMTPMRFFLRSMSPICNYFMVKFPYAFENVLCPPVNVEEIAMASVDHIERKLLSAHTNDGGAAAADQTNVRILAPKDLVGYQSQYIE